MRRAARTCTRILSHTQKHTHTNAHLYSDSRAQRSRWNTVYAVIYKRGRRRQTTDDKTPCICQRQNQKETFKNEPPPLTHPPRRLFSHCSHTHKHTSAQIHKPRSRGVGRSVAVCAGEGRSGAAAAAAVWCLARAAADSEQEKYENEKNRHCQTTTTAAAAARWNRPRAAAAADLFSFTRNEA